MRQIALATVAALVVSVQGIPTGNENPPSSSRCGDNSVSHCCNQIVQGGSVLGQLLGIANGVSAGIGCAISASCNAQTVCCNNAQSGVININAGCWAL
ncbi:hypothetical protein CPB86DRAFT_811042 [Serendipita vermifera]|nr:hypothetical protein CPB86DRAFT_811042 [Serendipita vermifera]